MDRLTKEGFFAERRQRILARVRIYSGFMLFADVGGQVVESPEYAADSWRGKAAFTRQNHKPLISHLKMGSRVAGLRANR